MAVLLDKFVFELLKSLPGLIVSRLHFPLHVNPDDGGPLPSDGLQLRPVGHVAPAREREVDVVAVRHLLLGPGTGAAVKEWRSEGDVVTLSGCSPWCWLRQCWMYGSTLCEFYELED